MRRLILGVSIVGSLASFADILELNNNLYIVNPANGKTSRIDIDELQALAWGNRPTVESGNIIKLHNNLYIVDETTGKASRIDLDQSQAAIWGTRPTVKK